MTLIALTKRAMRVAAPAVVAVLALACFSAPSQALIEIDVNKGNVQPLPIAIPALRRKFGGRADGRRHRGRHLVRSSALRPVPAARSQDLHRDDLVRQPAAELRRLEGARRAGAGHGRRRAPGGRAAARRLSPVGRLRRAADGGPAVLRAAGATGGRSRTRSPTRSISGSPARRATSTRASSSSTRPVRRPIASSGWRSWIRTAPTSAT